MKKITLLALLLSVFIGYAQPATNAPTPIARADGDVISIYSDAYTNLAGTDYNPNWGHSGAVNAAFDPTGEGNNTVLAYTNFDYQGTVLAAPFPDASSMENFHVDVWTATAGAVLKVSPINNGTGPGEVLVEVTLVNAGWSSVDLPKALFTDQTWDSVFQFKFDGLSGTTPADYYIDNLYFWKAATAGVEDISVNSVKMYPNPAQGVVNFSSASSDALTVSVFDVLGKQVLQAKTVQSQLNISSLNPGMYFVKMTQGSNSSTKKLVVK